MTEKLKLCKDCRFAVGDHKNDYKVTVNSVCSEPGCYTCPVTGEGRPYPREYCSAARLPGGACGPEGRKWQDRNAPKYRIKVT